MARAMRRLIEDHKTVTARVDRLETARPVVIHGRDGRDGNSPDVGEIVRLVLAELPPVESIDVQAIVNDIRAQIPNPRDGRDAPPVSVSDVATIVLSKIPKPKDGADGISPDADAIIAAVRAQVSDGQRGEQGPPGPQGPPGKNGVSVTDVQLRNNDLFVFLDGKKKKAGSIKLPPAPFRPIGEGGGGSARGATQDNAIYVASVDDFPIQDETTITLSANRIYVLTDHIITGKRFIVGDGALITARNINGWILTYTGTGTMFTVQNGGFIVEHLTIDCPNAQGFEVRNPDSNLHRFYFNTAFLLTAQKFGTFENLNTVEFLNSGTSDVADGVTLEGVKNAVITINRFALISTDPAFIGLDFTTSSFIIYEIENLFLSGPPSAIGISGLADSGNIPPGRRAVVINSEFSGLTPLQGIKINDIRWQFQNNVPVADSRNAADMFLAGGSETVTIVTAGVFVEVGTPAAPGVTWESDIADRFTVGADGVITYIGEIDIDVDARATVTVEKVGGGSDELEVRLAKNWQAGQSGIEKSRAVTQNASPTSVPVGAFVPLTSNDTLRVIFANNSTNTDIIVQVTNVTVSGG
jgi:hypothetical protein